MRLPACLFVLLDKAIEYCTLPLGYAIEKPTLEWQQAVRRPFENKKKILF